MKRHLTIWTLILTICITSCGQTKTETEFKAQQTNTFEVDTSLIAILTSGRTRSWVFKGGKQTKLTTDDLEKVEHILKKCISDYNADQEKKFEKINAERPAYKLDKKNFVIDLTQYKRQYVATINSKGEKEVWINCFCDTLDTDWKTHLIFVDDGGNCFFNLKVNLTTGQYFDLSVNGEA